MVHRLDCFFNLFDGDYSLIVVVNLVIQDLPNKLISNLSLLADALFQNGAGIDLHQVFVLCLDGLGKKLYREIKRFGVYQLFIVTLSSLFFDFFQFFNLVSADRFVGQCLGEHV